MRKIHLAKLGTTVDVPDHGEFSPAVQAYLQDLGLRKSLEGAMNDVNTKGETGKKLDGLRAEALGLVQKKLDSLIAGVVKTRVIGESDPVAKQARTLAIAKVQADQGYKDWVKANAPGKANEQEARNELYRRAQELAQTDAVIAVAEKMVEIAATLADL